ENEPVYVGISIGSLESEYWASLAAGAEMFCDALPEGAAIPIVMTALEADAQLANLEAFVNTYGSDGVLFVDSRTRAVTIPIVEMCEQSGTKVCLYSSIEEGLYPTDYENFVVFLTQDDYASAYMAATDLIEAIGGEGKICQLYGKLGSEPSEMRSQGLVDAVNATNGKVEILDTQVGNHDASTAMAIVENWIALYGEEIDAIFCSSDTMAVASAEALKNAGMAGSVKVSGFDGTQAAWECIRDGSMYSTIFNDGYMVGYYAAAYAYAAKVGTLDVNEMDPARRMFCTKVALVTIDNVDEYADYQPDFDYTDLDSCVNSIYPNASLAS
ncbi:MAG: sugar ABC transporter substrate-binding protein, partial [Clostridia bacterium]|nr:sugar ABC transporter substrate-binding protein [Clostridia bacterium]